MSRRPSVYQMVRQVIADSQEQLSKFAAAEDSGTMVDPEETQEPAEDEVKTASIDHVKVAEQCEFLAENIHLIEDTRTPQEKLAEYEAVQAELAKLAEDPPMNPSLDSGVAPGGPSSAMATEPNETPGENPFQGGDTGDATGGHQSPKTTTPTEKLFPADATNSMPTNKDMMFAEQPEAVLKQSSDAQASAILDRFARNGWVDREKLAAFKTKAQQQAFAANAAKAMAKQDASKPGAEMVGKTASAGNTSGIPRHFAQALGVKVAEDAINPAKVVAPTNPVLQSVAGVPSALMQGSEVGEKTPRETAPTSGQGDGRQHVSSIEAAMNYTKGQAKAPQKKALSEVLTEPALSAAHDNVLQKSLSNTSEAGVKISAAREMLKAASASSPEARRQLDAMLKAAMAGEPIPAPGAELGGAAEALAAPPEVSDEALAAAADGVTTDELAAAQEQMASQAAEAAQAQEALAAQATQQAAPEEAAPADAGAAPAQL